MHRVPRERCNKKHTLSSRVERCSRCPEPCPLTSTCDGSSPELLAIGSKALASRGWFNILRASFPGVRELRWRDAMAASFAGSGMNGLVPARGGDLVKLGIVRRRIAGACYSTLVATALPETSFESLCGVALVAWMVLEGALHVSHVTGQLSQAVSASLPRASIAALLVMTALVVSFATVPRLRRRWAGAARRMRQGLAIFSSPGRFVSQVASWQGLARMIRLASLACFLAAFGLPVTLGTATLVMATEGAARMLRLGPANVGLRMAMLSYRLAEVSGRPVNSAALAAFSLGQSATMLAVTFLIAAVVIAREFGTCAPWRAMRRARACLQGRQPGLAEAARVGP